MKNQCLWGGVLIGSVAVASFLIGLYLGAPENSTFWPSPAKISAASSAVSAIIGSLSLVLILLTWHIYRVQIFQAGSTDKLGRWRIVWELEEALLRIHASQDALQLTNDTEGMSSLEVRHVLDNEPNWEFQKDETTPVFGGGWHAPRSRTIDGKRYWEIRRLKQANQTIVQFMGSPYFHHALIWFRRADRALADGIITPSELAGMWRQILPMAYSNRITYFNNYFNGAQDIAPMVRIVNTVLSELGNQQHHNALKRAEHFSGSDNEILHNAITSKPVLTPLQIKRST